MRIEKKPIENLYVKKLETAFIYECLALKLKGFSEAIYLRFMNFREQDRAHALALHGFLVELDKLSNEQSTVAIQPYRIQGIGMLDKEDDEKELFIKMTRETCESLAYCEKQIIRSVMGINQYYPHLVELARPHIVLDGLSEISNQRIHVLSRLDTSVQTGFLFNRKDEETVWKCAYCGSQTTGAEAPEECPCCSQPQQYQIYGDWII